MFLAQAWRKASTFLRYHGFVRAWFLPVWVGLGVARALVLVVPFGRIAPRLGRPVGAVAVVPEITDAMGRRARLIALTIGLAAAYTPWDSNCFAQAIVARVLLGLHGVPYALCLGVRRDEGEPAGIKAHAWVASGRVAVSGGVGSELYAVVGCYVSPLLDARQRGS
jgi:hypothetical protein